MTFLSLSNDVLMSKCWASYPASPIDNYGVIIPEWKVEVSPDGPIVILPGTIEEVHETLLELNPDWDIDYSAYFDTPRSTLAKRYDFSRDEYFCRDRWPECSADAIETGVNYLRGVPGAPVNGPGPGNCGRVSCSYDSAIWWCNDVSSFSFYVYADSNLRILCRMRLQNNSNTSATSPTALISFSPNAK